jgi:methylmalonyl-CoA mutase N-terminal domain/subunit
MTINGPAAMILAFFMNAAIDQQCELYIKAKIFWRRSEQKIKAIYDDKNALNAQVIKVSCQKEMMAWAYLLLGITGDQVLPHEVYSQNKNRYFSQVRGTVQADILKEDQAQNTCIFSTEFAFAINGRCAGIFHSTKTFVIFIQFQSVVTILPKPAPIQLHNWHLHLSKWIYICRILLKQGHGHQ